MAQENVEVVRRALIARRSEFADRLVATRRARMLRNARARSSALRR